MTDDTLSTHAKWFVRLAIEGPLWQDHWKHDWRGWASCSSDAIAHAIEDFYGLWARPADRERLPTRVVECMQEGI